MPNAPSGPPVLRAGRSPLVGRARQMAVLAEHLEEAQAGRPSVVLLDGPPGIGKTRLLEEFPPRELAQGVTLLRGGASQAEGMPLALLLDDLQWADAATFDLLVHVAGRLRSARLLIVGAYREGEAGDNRAFVRAVAELNRRRLLVTLPLRPLEVEESRVLAANMLRGEISTGIADLLHRQGEGNPFFLEELLRALIEDGTLVWQDERWQLGSDPRKLVPPRLAEAIGMRLARLHPEVVELLRVAVVVGRTFEPAVLARAVQMDIEQVEELLLAAVRPAGAAGSRWRIRLRP